MKYLFLLIVLSTINNIFGQDTYPKEIIGTWDFVELIDENGGHIDTVVTDGGIWIPNGPIWIIKEDGTYTRQYTAINTDKGTWTFNKTTNEIILKLYWRKPYDEVAKYVMTLGYAKKDKNGDYYDLIPQKIIEFTSEKLIIFEKENQLSVYKKISEE